MNDPTPEPKPLSRIPRESIAAVYVETFPEGSSERRALFVRHSTPDRDCCLERCYPESLLLKHARQSSLDLLTLLQGVQSTVADAVARGEFDES